MCHIEKMLGSLNRIFIMGMFFNRSEVSNVIWDLTGINKGDSNLVDFLEEFQCFKCMEAHILLDVDVGYPAMCLFRRVWFLIWKLMWRIVGCNLAFRKNYIICGRPVYF